MIKLTNITENASRDFRANGFMILLDRCLILMLLIAGMVIIGDVWHNFIPPAS